MIFLNRSSSAESIYPPNPVMLSEPVNSMMGCETGSCRGGFPIPALYVSYETILGALPGVALAAVIGKITS